MRVWSWNMYCYNKRHDDVVALVRNSEADIFFLQEVPFALRDTLCALYPFSAYAVDSERVYGGHEWTNYNLILSRYPLTDTRPIPFDPIPLTLRTKLVILTLTPLGWARTWNRNAVRAVAHTDHGAVTVVSAHLTLSAPTLRMREFESVLKDVHAPCIIGGDFNVIEHPPLKILSWLLGAHVREALPWYNERAIWDTIFTNAKLVNPLGGRVTHDFSRSQLDHIVVSESYTISDSGVFASLAGSDHAPVWVTIT